MAGIIDEASVREGKIAAAVSSILNIHLIHLSISASCRHESKRADQAMAYFKYRRRIFRVIMYTSLG